MSVEDRVKAIIVEQLGVDADEVNPDASFVEDLGAVREGVAGEAEQRQRGGRWRCHGHWEPFAVRRGQCGLLRPVLNVTSEDSPAVSTKSWRSSQNGAVRLAAAHR